MGQDAGDETIEPLDLKLLRSLHLNANKVEWRVSVANRKVVRRTGNNHDLVAADTGWFSDHKSHPLQGHCKNFISEKACIAFGHVRFIRPTISFPESGCASRPRRD